MYILLAIFGLIVFIIYLKYDSISTLFQNIIRNYQSIKNVENIEKIKSQMSDLENYENFDNIETDKKSSYYSEKLQEAYNIITLKYFDIFDNLSKSWNYFYEQYLLPIYYKNFYVNVKRE